MRKSTYTAIIKRDDTYYLNNTLHGTALTVRDPDFQAAIDSIADGKPFLFADGNPFHTALLDNQMLVEDPVKEYQLVEYLCERELMKTDAAGIFIVTTRDCNFRCTYCYEEHNKQYMTWETYEQIIEATDAYVRENGVKSLIINMFGGEPMLEYDHVCRFMELLREKLPDDVMIIGLMVTNGYLLNLERFRKLVSLGINNFMVTVDGLAEMHNQTRYLAGGQGTWDTIVDNLKAIKNEAGDFSVVVKSVITEAFLDQAGDWFDWAETNLMDDPRFAYDLRPASDPDEYSRGLTDYAFMKSRKESMRYVVDQIFDIAAEHGVDLSYYGNKLGIVGAICFSGHPMRFGIDYDGKLVRCNRAFDEENNCVGHVVDGRFVWDLQKDADYIHYDVTSCRDCVIYPICYGKCCPLNFDKHYKPEDCKLWIKFYETFFKLGLGEAAENAVVVEV